MKRNSTPIIAGLVCILQIGFIPKANCQEKPNQITDLQWRSGDESSSPAIFGPINESILLSAFDPVVGRELYTYDGTELKLLKDIYPGSQGSRLSLGDKALSVEGKPYFVAEDPSGFALWTTDGTPSGTVRVSEYLPAEPNEMTAVGGSIFWSIEERSPSSNFNINSLYATQVSDGSTSVVYENKNLWDMQHGLGAGDLFFFTEREVGSSNSRLWRSDGTTEGTYSITEELAGNAAEGNTSEFTQFAALDGVFYFVAANPEFPFSLYSIIRSDGTPEGTFALADVGTRDETYRAAEVVSVNNKLYFSFSTRAGNDLTIWETDGTQENTHTIFDGYSNSTVWASNLATDGQSLVFVGPSEDQQTSSLFTWKEDVFTSLGNIELTPPTTSFRLIDSEKVRIQSLANGNFHMSLISVGNTLHYFTEVADSSFRENDKYAGLGSRPLVPLGDGFVFSFFTSQLGTELYKADASFGTPGLVKNINRRPYGYSQLGALPELYYYQDALYFRANADLVGAELYVYQDETLSFLKDIRVGSRSSFPNQLTGFTDHVYFTATTAENGEEVWRTDGTSGGTVLVNDAYEGTASSMPRWFTMLGEELHFVTRNDGNIYLNRTNGTDVGPYYQLPDNPFGGTLLVKEMAATNSHIFFIANGVGNDLYLSDGTEEGTVLIKELTRSESLTPAGETMFFASQGMDDSETEFFTLWKSDGTAEGTVRVVSDSAQAPQHIQSLFYHENRLYFTASTDGNGRELWVSDGTDEGTFMLKDVHEGSSSGLSTPSFASFKGHLYFMAADADHGKELWRTDGTAEGTTMVTDLGGSIGSDPRDLIATPDFLFFGAYTSDFGRELWKTDGTPEGTELAYDLVGGPASSFPLGLVDGGDRLFFTAFGNGSGQQVWSYLYEEEEDDDDDDDVVSHLDGKQPAIFKVYPNPVQNSLQVNWKLGIW